MTDRAHGLVVTFEEDMRVDDIEDLRNAILMLKGVISVAPMITGYRESSLREQARWELQSKLWAVLQKEKL